MTLKLVMGLGNPGERYALTPHNAGFWVIDAFAQELGVRLRENKSQKCASCEVSFEGQDLLLLKPLNFMNLSGDVAVPFAKKNNLEASQALVIHDEVDLEEGVIRLKRDGGSGGHNGLKSLISHWGDSFFRLRVGVGKQVGVDTADHVLSPWSKKRVQVITQKGLEALKLALSQGPNKAMNQVNR